MFFFFKKKKTLNLVYLVGLSIQLLAFWNTKYKYRGVSEAIEVERLIEMEEKRQKQCMVVKQPKYFQSSFGLLFYMMALILPLIVQSHDSFNYGDALSKSLLYFESQRSGRLPHNQRVTWRHHSGLTDGLEQGVRPFTL